MKRGTQEPRQGDRGIRTYEDACAPKELSGNREGAAASSSGPFPHPDGDKLRPYLSRAGAYGVTNRPKWTLVS